MRDEQPDKVKLLQPYIHFKTSHIKIGDDYTTDKIAVTELVRAKDTLASFENAEIYEQQGYEKAPVEPGDNAIYGEDGESILAAITGYPKIIKRRVKGVSEMVTIISIEPLIVISPDNMQAAVSLHPPIDGASPVTATTLQDIISEHGIIYGIDNTAIAKINLALAEKAIEFTKIVFAKGIPVGESFDSYLRFDMEIGPIAGTILENGNIDFRERRIMVGVEAGQRIATKIPSILGKPGMNIFGEETPARVPIDIKVQSLNDAKFVAASNEVTATKAGVLSIVNNNVIKVLSHQVIQGDINYETGNIDSKNCVTVIGSVQPGFKVHTDGDLKIGGSVMSASITSDANLVINGGITGKKSTIVAAGDCDINFIEQGSLNSGGLCVIRKQSYYSEVTADRDIRCKPASKIIGGLLYAGGSISLFDVGADTSVPCSIAAGVVPTRLRQYEEMKQSIIDQEEAIVQWVQRYKGSSTSRKIRKMEKELADTKLKRIRFNLIPGTGKYSRVTGPNDAPDDKNEEYIDEGGIDIQQITIDAHGSIYKDTEIRIGNLSLKLQKTVAHRQFKIHSNGKRIIAVPLKINKRTPPS